MRFSVLTTLAALAFGVSQADVGCTVDLSLTGTSADNSERILYGMRLHFPAILRLRTHANIDVGILGRLNTEMDQTISSVSTPS